MLPSPDPAGYSSYSPSLTRGWNLMFKAFSVWCEDPKLPALHETSDVHSFVFSHCARKILRPSGFEQPCRAEWRSLGGRLCFVRHLSDSPGLWLCFDLHRGDHIMAQGGFGYLRGLDKPVMGNFFSWIIYIYIYIAHRHTHIYCIYIWWSI